MEYRLELLTHWISFMNIKSKHKVKDAVKDLYTYYTLRPTSNLGLTSFTELSKRGMSTASPQFLTTCTSISGHHLSHTSLHRLQAS